MAYICPDIKLGPEAHLYNPVDLASLQSYNLARIIINPCRFSQDQLACVHSITDSKYLLLFWDMIIKSGGAEWTIKLLALIDSSTD